MQNMRVARYGAYYTVLSIWQEMDEEDGSGARQINMYLLAIRRHYGSMCWLNNGYCLAVALSEFDQIRTVGYAIPWSLLSA